MSGKSRRDFLKTSAVIGAGITGLSTTTAKAAPKNILSEDRMGAIISNQYELTLFKILVQ